MEMYTNETQMRAQAAYENRFNHTLHAHIDIAGDLVAGTLLSQILFWFAPTKDGGRKVRVQQNGHFWLAKERTEWYDEIRISPKQFDRAVKELEKRELIVKGLFKFNNKTTIHVRPNPDIINREINNWKLAVASEMEESIAQESAQDMGFTQRSNLDLPKGQTKIYPKVKSRFTQKGIPSITEITTETTTGITTTTEVENRVVVVREKYEYLFQKKLTKKQAEDLIALADKHQVDVIKKIENTYEMHKVEPRKSVIKSIEYAIEVKDWEIASSTVSPQKPLPKSVARQREGKHGQQEHTPEQLAHIKAEIERKKAMMYEDAEEVS